MHVAFIVTALTSDSGEVARRQRVGRKVANFSDIEGPSRVMSWVRGFATGGAPRRWYTALGGTLSGLTAMLHERAVEIRVSHLSCTTR